MAKKFYDEHIGDVLKNYLSKGNKRLSERYVETKIKAILKDKMGELLSGYTSTITYSKGSAVRRKCIIEHR